MTRFCLDSDDLFIYVPLSINEIRVFKSDKIHQPIICSNEWTTIKTLKPDDGDQLELFNCVIQGPELKQLALEIGQHKWTVNREGCIYMYAPEIKSDYRINDFFGWSKYGVHLSRRTTWNKLELNTKEVVVDITEKDKSLADYIQKLEKKEQELSSYKEQLEKIQEENLSVCQKKLKELEAEKEEESSSYKKLLKEKEEELSHLEICITKKEEEFKSIEKEFSQIKKSLDEKIRNLNAVNVELEVSKREMLEKKDQELSSYKEQLEKMQEEKAFVSQKKLKELETKKEEELSFYKKLLKEKEKELSCLEIHIRKKEEEFNSIENEFSQIKNSLEEKVGDLSATKVELEVNRRVVLVWVTLLERQLKLEDLWRGNQEDDCKKMHEELSLHKKKLKMIEGQLNEVNYKLLIERKKVNAFRAALKCLVTFLEDHNTRLEKDFNYEIMLPTLCDAKHVDALKGLRGGVTVSKISSTILQIVEQQNYAEE